MKPEQAIAMASINAARIYGLKKIGAVAAGYQADLVVFEDFASLKPELVLHKGQDVSKLISEITPEEPGDILRGTVNIGSNCNEDSFSICHFKPERTYPVIEMLPGEIFTERGEILGADVPKALEAGNLCMIAVIERHHATGNVGLGLIRGYGLKRGAAATTVGHDSHNVIVVGTNSKDMYLAVQGLIMQQGGYILVKNGEVVDSVQLDICGLMSSASTEDLCESLERISVTAHKLGVSEGVDPFISLSFMALPVIPKLRITDIGMFDAENFKFL